MTRTGSRGTRALRILDCVRKPVVIGLMMLALSGCGTGASEWVAGWQTMTPMITSRAGAAVIDVNGVIYAIGGIDGQDFLRTVEYSRIDVDGNLGQWQLTSPLNDQRGFFAVAYYRGYLYVAGGGNGPSGHHLLRTVERARVLPSGGLGAWSMEKNTLVYPRRCAKLVVVGDDMYAVGGFSGVLLDTVEHAKILSDGHVGPWTLMKNKLTMPRYIHGLKKNRKGLYVVGGHSDISGTGQDKVEWQPLFNQDAPWRLTSALHTGRYALATAVHGDFIYALGGLNGPKYLDSIEKAEFAADGSLNPWTFTTVLPTPLAHLGVVVYKKWIYVVGGTYHSDYFKRVERATFNDKGDIGFWATPEQAAAWRKQRQALHKASSLAMPNRGVVEQVIQTGVYSYIRVRGANGLQWLAAPRAEVRVGDHIRYSRGMEMVDFESRQLRRHFASILFVEGVEKAAPGQD